MKLLPYSLPGALLCLAGSCIAQPATKPICRLTVGDTLPMNLVLINSNQTPVSTIRLSDVKARLIILDFWGRYCAPCLELLQKLQLLQQPFGGDIQVITISDFRNQQDFKKTKERLENLRTLHLPVSLANKKLSTLFPHRLYSHLVWLSSDGVVKAITGSDYVTEAHLREALTNQTLDWDQKVDAVDFDYSKPLLSFTQADIVQPTQAYYSTFTSHIEGIAPPSGTTIDSTTQTSYTAFYNHDLLAFCQIALSYSGGASRDQFNLHVKDTSRYLPPDASSLKTWQQKNTWCYYSRLPANLSAEVTQTLVQQDILRWLAVLGISVRKVEKTQNGTIRTFYEITEHE